MLHEEKILEFCNIDSDIKYKYDSRGRLNITKLLYHVLGYEINDEIAKVLLDPSNSMLIAATAGSGKSTTISTKIALAKATQYSEITGELIKGNRSLALMYNPHNVKDVKSKHNDIMTKLSCIEGIPNDKELKATTLHSFCREWILTLPNEFDLPVTAYTPLNPVMSDSTLTKMFIDSLETMYEKEIADIDINIEDLKTFYSLVRESLIDYQDMYAMDEFSSLGIKSKELEGLFKSIDMMKKFLKRFDFTDTLVAMNNALSNSEKLAQRIHEHYDIITVDEVQDFTPVMMSIIEKLQYKGTQIICVGDDDQLIYGFKGADLCNTLEFKNRFKNGRIATLSVNRRCPSNVLDVAVSVISHNQFRLEKKIKSCREGGKVELLGYSNALSKELQLKKLLDTIPPEDYDETVICYRKSVSSIPLIKLLVEGEKVFHVTNGVEPFSDRIYDDVYEIIGLMLRPDNPFGTQILYKFLPITKSEFAKCIGYDYKNKDWINGYDRINFYDRSYSKYDNKPRFKEVMKVLQTISLNISKASCNDFIQFIKKCYTLYHYNFIMDTASNREVKELYLNDSFSYFETDDRAISAYTSFENYREEVTKNKRFFRGIMVSNFHGLKGLEKKTVIIVDMDEDIFPNYERIDAPENRTEAQKQKLKEDEVRLFYVALTRAKENVYISYSENNPSRYIDWINNPETDYKTFIPESVKEINKLYNFTEEDDSFETSTIPELEVELVDVGDEIGDIVELEDIEDIGEIDISPVLPIDESESKPLDLSAIEDKEPVKSSEDKFTGNLETSNLMGGFLNNILNKL